MRMPKSWALLVKEAELLEESGKIALALEVSKMAVDVASGSTQAWLSYADVCVSAGLYEEARAHPTRLKALTHTTHTTKTHHAHWLTDFFCALRH